jgi:hypothetical protein
MPAIIKEAFRSPYHQSQLISERPEYNTDYHLLSDHLLSDHLLSDHPPQKLPKYKPYLLYPTLHPTQNHSSSNLNDLEDIDDSDSTIIRDPHQGAGWIQSQDQTCAESNENQFINKNSKVNTLQTHTKQEESCETLIMKVLSNRHCRQLLKKILNEDDSKIPQYKGIIEGFTTHFQSTTVKSIIVYCLAGLLILCLLELLIKFAQALKK